MKKNSHSNSWRWWSNKWVVPLLVGSLVAAAGGAYYLDYSLLPARRSGPSRAQLSPLPEQEEGPSWQHEYQEGDLHCVSHCCLTGSLPIYIQRRCNDSSEHLILKPVNPQEHYAELYELVASSAEFIAKGDPVPVELMGKDKVQTHQFLLRSARKGDSVGVFHRTEEGERLVGRIAWSPFRALAEQTGEKLLALAYFMGDPEYTGVRGCMTLAVQAVTDFLFFTGQVDRCLVVVKKVNRASRRVAEKLGMRCQEASQVFRGKEAHWPYPHFILEESLVYTLDRPTWEKSWQRRCSKKAAAGPQAGAARMPIKRRGKQSR
jgi:RimJ/RimL family protein N-acetyltransferase